MDTLEMVFLTLFLAFNGGLAFLLLARAFCHFAPQICSAIGLIRVKQSGPGGQMNDLASDAKVATCAVDGCHSAQREHGILSFR